jgi:cobalt-zinc-cadmium resistance protein CzcA
MLAWSEKHSRTVIIVTISVFLVSVGLATRLGGEFIPTLEEGSLTTTVTRWPSASLPTVIDEIGKQERIIRSFPEVRTGNKYWHTGCSDRSYGPQQGQTVSSF